MVNHVRRVLCLCVCFLGVPMFHPVPFLGIGRKRILWSVLLFFPTSDRFRILFCMDDVIHESYP